MKQVILDLKLSIVAGTYFAITFSNVDYVMKILAFLITVGYTIRRWYLMEKNNKK
jgi:hypothetical protein